ncbi:hypothetical protein CVT26_003140, partial [Gymnopilus dilepis]
VPTSVPSSKLHSRLRYVHAVVLRSQPSFLPPLLSTSFLLLSCSRCIFFYCDVQPDNELDNDGVEPLPLRLLTLKRGPSVLVDDHGCKIRKAGKVLPIILSYAGHPQSTQCSEHVQQTPPTAPYAAAPRPEPAVPDT